MKKYFAIFLLWTTQLHSQKIGNQDSLSVPTQYYVGGKISLVNGLIYTPPDYNPQKKYPFIFNFAGTGQRGYLKNLFTCHNVATEIEEGWKPEFIVFTPVLPQTNEWSYLDGSNIKPMLAYLKSKYSIDETRCYATGLSAGGWATYATVLEDTALAKQFAAVVPVSAQANGSVFDNIKKYNIGVWIICGNADPHYPENIRQQDSIIKHGGNAILTTLNGYGHDDNTWKLVYSPTFNYNGKSIYDWMLQYSSSNQTSKPVDTIPVIDTISQKHPNWIVIKETSGSINLNNYIHKPKDTVYIPYGSYSYAHLDYYKGDTSNFAVILAHGKFTGDGQPFLEGFRFTGCVGVKVDGDYEITSTSGQDGSALTVEGLSSYIEFWHFTVHGVGIGAWAHPETVCQDSLSYPHRVKHIWFMYGKIVHTNNEGMYLGSTQAGGNAYCQYCQHPIVVCNGDTTKNRPMQLDGFKVEGCIVDSTGRGGVQLSNAPGNSEVCFNHVTNSGLQSGNGGWQGNNFAYGSNDSVYSHDNYGAYSGASNMQSFPTYMYSTRDTLTMAGHLGSTVGSLAANILVDSRPQDDSSTVVIVNDVLGVNTDANIRWYNSYNMFTKKGNTIVGNYTKYIASTVNIDTTLKPPIVIPAKILGFTQQGNVFSFLRSDGTVTVIQGVANATGNYKGQFWYHLQTDAAGIKHSIK